jgi:hypothetical protein
MPTSASRRVWEGKAGNYNPDIGGLESPMMDCRRELASYRQF